MAHALGTPAAPVVESPAETTETPSGAEPKKDGDDTP